MSVNIENVNNIREQIQNKLKSTPYFADIDTGAIVLTDYDSFPYKRWWRGIPQYHKPIVAEREAGWRPINNSCYKPEKNTSIKKNFGDYCFQSACSTVFPCNKNNIVNHSQNFLDVELNKNCVVEYR